MASIGPIKFDPTASFDSGIAFLLVRPPRGQALTIAYDGGSIALHPKCPFAVCEFAGATSHDGVLQRGSELLQEGLDILSMTRAVDVATRDSEDEYFAWWNESGKRHIGIISTGVASMSVGTPTLEVRDDAGNIVPPRIVRPQHNLGFRYFRLAQVSDDLFDSFRNMYLAFELLLSSRYPKERKVREIDWLRASLKAASTDLNLASLVPSQSQPAEDQIIKMVYSDARLPLFHAKNGRTFYAPMASSPRETVETARSLLTMIVMRMAETWYSARRLRGGVNLKILYDSFAKQVKDSRFIVGIGSEVTPNAIDLPDELITGPEFDAHYMTNFGMSFRPHVTGKLALTRDQKSQTIRAVRLTNKEASLVLHTLEAKLGLEGFDVLKVVQFFKAVNSTEPRTLIEKTSGP